MTDKTIKLYDGVNNESWRERFADIDDEVARQEMADDLRDAVCDWLVDHGYEVETAYQQRVGTSVICQTRDLEAVFLQAIHTCENRMRADLSAANSTAQHNDELLQSARAFAGFHPIASLELRFTDGVKADLWLDKDGKLQTAQVTTD